MTRDGKIELLRFQLDVILGNTPKPLNGVTNVLRDLWKTHKLYTPKEWAAVIRVCGFLVDDSGYVWPRLISN